MANVIVLAWIGQILLFFIAWKVFHWVVGTTQKQVPLTLWMELFVNLLLSIVLLVVLSNVSSAWWLMLIVGAAIGVVTGKMGRNSAG